MRGINILPATFFVAAMFLLSTSTGAFAAAHVEITVGAGSSLIHALQLVKESFEKANPGVSVWLTFSSSGAITAQVRQGAPLDAVVFPAGGGHMDMLEAEGRIVGETRFVVAGDEIVLIAPRDTHVEGDPWGWLWSASVRRIAIGDPGLVPAGVYAMQVLRHMGIDKAVADRLVYMGTVQQVLTCVELGDVDAGLVYGSTLHASRRARLVAEAPRESHERVIFEGAMVRATEHHREARTFLDYLRSPEAKTAFRLCGFDTP